MTDTHITHIIFDLDGTLVDESVRLVEQAEAVAGTFGEGQQEMQATIDAFFAANDRAVQEGGAHKHDIAKYMQWMGETLGIDVSKEKAKALAVAWSEAYDASHDQPVLFDDVIPALQMLKDEGYTLLIASGNTAETRTQLLETVGIDEYFSDIFAATDVGFQKQDVQFWEHVCTALNIPSEQIAVVGNQINDDIMHPQTLGMTTLFVDRPDVLRKNLGPKDVFADHTITNLEEISSLL